MAESLVKTTVDLRGSFEPLVKGFTDKTERGILRGALRRTSQQVIAKAARKNLKVSGGARHTKAVTVKTSVTNQQATARTGAKRGTPLAKIGHLIEGGAAPHIVRAKRAKVMIGRKDGIFYGRRVKHPGRPAKPWMNPALEDNVSEVTERFGQLIREEIDKAVEKGKR